ncbi:MAG: cupin domain-containing protein [Pseudomonadota bacterium]|nr:cupin domain-containing protein [Pseudomonadota bacterium]MEE3099212.1 cupin domain-containing protein [Pseudomonadota bacterium]
MIRTLIAAALAAAPALAPHSTPAHEVETADVSVVYDQPLPNVPGKSMRGVLVDYAPGGTSPAHTHPDSAFIYAIVLEGAIRSAVNDGPVVEYRVGESWSEFPGDRHSVSENASATAPARLLAVFVIDTDETELATYGE